MNIVQHIYRDNIEFLRRIVQLAYETINECNNLWFNLMKPVGLPKNEAGRKFRKEKIESIQKKAFSYLSRLYNLSKGESSGRFDMYEVGKELGYDTSNTEYIVETLARSELIGHEKNSSNVSITSYGIMTINGDIAIGYAPIH